jgi:hypothetical protein
MAETQKSRQKIGEISAEVQTFAILRPFHRFITSQNRFLEKSFR